MPGSYLPRGGLVQADGAQWPALPNVLVRPLRGGADSPATGLVACAATGAGTAPGAGTPGTVRGGEEGKVRAGEEGSVRGDEEGCVPAGEEGSVRAGEEGNVRGGEDGSVRGGEDGNVRAGEVATAVEGCARVLSPALAKDALRPHPSVDTAALSGTSQMCLGPLRARKVRREKRKIARTASAMPTSSRILSGVQPEGSTFRESNM